jgi:hypothetical protein
MGQRCAWSDKILKGVVPHRIADQEGEIPGNFWELGVRLGHDQSTWVKVQPNILDGCSFQRCQIVVRQKVYSLQAKFNAVSILEKPRGWH